MDIKINKINVDSFDELNIFNNNDFLKYKTKRIKQINNKECDVFVISSDDKYIGEITVKYVNGELKTETIPNVRVYFEAFRISDEYQGKGLGNKLLDYVIKYLKKLKYTEFTIGVEDDNEVAKHLYNKYGFNEKIDVGYDKESKTNYILYIKR